MEREDSTNSCVHKWKKRRWKDEGGGGMDSGGERLKERMKMKRKRTLQRGQQQR